MFENTQVIRNMAKELYAMSRDEAEPLIRAMPKWPASRGIRRIVPIWEATDKLVKVELAELVFIGFIVIIEADSGVWYPARVFDLKTGTNSDEMVKVARGDIELARALKGNSAPLDELKKLWD